MKSEYEHLRLNEKKWDKWSKSYDKKGWLRNKLRDSQSGVVSTLEIKENINFLDVGCGTGYAVGEAAKLAKYKGEFYGIDLSSKMIEKAKANFNSKNNFHFIKANADSIPLIDNLFDIIICTNSFHHYLNPDKVLNEVYRLLREGGKLYLHDLTADNWFVKFTDKIAKMIEPEHVKIYSTEEFQELFKNAGLKYLSSMTLKVGGKIHIAEKHKDNIN